MPTKEVGVDDKWKWFQDCFGAIDGTSIPVTVPTHAQGGYRNSKQQLAINVSGVCDRDMRFVYVLPEWEGSASDSQVLRSALTRSRPLVIPSGKST